MLGKSGVHLLYPLNLPGGGDDIKATLKRKAREYRWKGCGEWSCVPCARKAPASSRPPQSMLGPSNNGPCVEVGS